LLSWCVSGLAVAQSVSAQQVATAADQTGSSTDPPAAESDELIDALRRRGDLNLHNLSLNAALFTISEQWNVNIVAGDVQGTVNGVFKQAPLSEILDSILLSNGYNYRAVGKSLVVSSTDELGMSSPSLQSATIPVQSADIEEAVEGAKLLLTPQGKVQALKSARSIVVLDYPDRLQMVREFVATIDGVNGGRFAMPGSRVGLPLEVGYFRTQYISAKAAEQALAAVLSKDGRVGVMEKEDGLIVTDYAENLAIIAKALERLDQPRPQVRITALIYDISLQDIEKLGINWNHTVNARIDASGDPQTSLGIDSIMQVPFEVGTAGSTLTLMNLSRHLDITAVAVALQNANDARLLADPHVVVQDNEEAIFESVSEIPYQQLTETQQGGNIGTTAFRDAGIILHVRPKIAFDGTIAMKVMPEFSRLTGFTPGDNQPIIDRRTASTLLRVGNRQTLVIGGLRQRSDLGDFNGVPYLKDIPLIGRAFRARDTNVRESELVVFVMPEIINYADAPNSRQQLVANTIHGRLDQIPAAEACDTFSEPLPGDPPMIGPPSEPWQPNPAISPAANRVTPADAPPLQTANVPPAENQLVPVGSRPAPPFAAGQVRRLPAVTTTAPPGPRTAVPSEAENMATRLFAAPLANQSGRLR
jgi:general secretion pathway protein D